MTRKQMRQLVQAARCIALAHNEGDIHSLHNLKGLQAAVTALGGYLEVSTFKGLIHQIRLSYGKKIEGVLIPNEEGE